MSQSKNECWHSNNCLACCSIEKNSKIRLQKKFYNIGHQWSDCDDLDRLVASGFSRSSGFLTFLLRLGYVKWRHDVQQKDAH